MNQASINSEIASILNDMEPKLRALLLNVARDMGGKVVVDLENGLKAIIDSELSQITIGGMHVDVTGLLALLNVVHTATPEAPVELAPAPAPVAAEPAPASPVSTIANDVSEVAHVADEIKGLFH